MAFGTDSKVFPAFIRDCLNNTASHAHDVDGDTLKVALFGNSGTPAQSAVNTLTGYDQATSAWVSANEVTATGWAAGGLTLASVTSTFSSVTYTLDAADRSGGASDSVTNAHGVLIFNSSIATYKDGIAYLAFGGAVGNVSSTFTVVFHANGILTFVA